MIKQHKRQEGLVAFKHNSMKKVLKFGGSSVASYENASRAIEAIQISGKHDNIVAVVFSALGGVTDELIALAHTSSQQDKSYEKTLKALEKRHFEMAMVVDPKHQKGLIETLEKILEELRNLIKGIFLVKDLQPQTLDLVMSFGERLSCTIMTAFLQNHGMACTYLDARTCIETDDTFGNARVDMGKTKSNLQKHFKNAPSIQIVTGFLGRTPDGKTTTLGRGGSDYTASIVGSALGVDVIEIWTDVDGVLTADPRKVKDAFVLEEISYPEIMEMAHFGAKVLHPPSIKPAQQAKITLLIKNTFNPHAPGTKIFNEASAPHNQLIRGISSIDKVMILRFQGSGMIGMSGTAMRLFKALKALSRIVYFDTPEDVKDAMFKQYLEDPKPVVWGDLFSIEPNETQHEALKRAYPLLLNHRQKQYEAWAHQTIAYEKRRDDHFSIDDLLKAIGQ